MMATDITWRTPEELAADAAERDTAFHERVSDEAARERVRREARRQVDAEERGAIEAPDIVSLRDWLATPDTAERWRIEGWQPAETRVILAAQMKAGKTTLVGSTLRSLVDGDRWLGVARVESVDSAALIDTEMGARQLRRWLRDQQIRHDDRVHVVPLRGRVASFDLLDTTTRARWAAWLRARRVQYLVVDCLRPILDALGLDEHKDAGRWLVAFDALLRDAGIPEALLIHHMGHMAERSRGDSRLRDWPDVEWRLVRQDDDQASPRFLAAYGRDVEVSESQLAYDPSSRRLTLLGGSRTEAKNTRVLDAILEALAAEQEPLSGRRIKDALVDSDHSRDAIDLALKAGARSGQLLAVDGPRRSRLYRVSGSVRSVSAGHSPDRVSECPAAFTKADTPDTQRSQQPSLEPLMVTRTLNPEMRGGRNDDF